MSQKYKVLVCDRGKADYEPWTNAAGGGALLRKGRALAWFPEAGRKGPTSPQVGLGKLMQSWAGKNQKTGSMEPYKGGMG